LSIIVSALTSVLLNKQLLGTYHAGIFRGTFPAALAWFKGTFLDRSSPMKRFPPTWSWASLDYGICYVPILRLPEHNSKWCELVDMDDEKLTIWELVINAVLNRQSSRDRSSKVDRGRFPKSQWHIV